MLLIPKRLFSSNRKYLASYAILKIKSSATSKDIRDSFLRLSKIYHPDNTETGNHNRFLKLKTAYDQIKDAPLMSSTSVGNPTRMLDEGYDLSHKAYVQSVQTSYGMEIAKHYVPSQKGRLGFYKETKLPLMTRIASKIFRVKTNKHNLNPEEDRF